MLKTCATARARRAHAGLGALFGVLGIACGRIPAAPVNHVAQCSLVGGPGADVFVLNHLAANRGEPFRVTVDGAIALRDRSGCFDRPDGSRAEYSLWMIPQRTGSFGFEMELIGSPNGARPVCTVECIRSGAEVRGDHETMRCGIAPGFYRVTGTVRRVARSRWTLEVESMCALAPTAGRTERSLRTSLSP